MRKQIFTKGLMAFVVAGSAGFFVPQLSQAAPPGRVSAPPKTITILGRTLALKERKGGGLGQGAMAAYIAPNETVDNWTLMFTVYYAPGKADPKQTALDTLQKIQLRKASKPDPLATGSVFESKDGSSANVDFLVSSTTPKLLEHNVFRYFRSAGGLSSYQIARRIFGTRTNGAEVSQFLRVMPKARAAMFAELNRPDMPTWPN